MVKVVVVAGSVTVTVVVPGDVIVVV